MSPLDRHPGPIRLHPNDTTAPTAWELGRWLILQDDDVPAERGAAALADRLDNDHDDEAGDDCCGHQ